MIYLEKHEVVEDLQTAGLRLIQSTDGFHFGEDSVLLANYVVNACRGSRKASGCFYDLGCNSGIVALLLAGKLPASRMTGVEIVPSASNLFDKNIQLNNMSSRVTSILANWKNIPDICDPASADVVVSNPPYGYRSVNRTEEPDEQCIAREEIYSDVSGIAQATAYLLKQGGLSFYIYRMNRLTDVLLALRANHLEPVRLRLVHPYVGKAPNSFIVTARKSGKPSGLTVEKPLVIFDSPTVYSKEVQEMYGKCPTFDREALYEGITLRLE